MDIKELIKVEFGKYGFHLDDNQIQQFNTYYNYLIQENAKYNLTAITSPDEVVLKHFIDSALGAECISQNAYICDIGSGAGFPAIPLKIIRPDLRIVMVDSLNKRVNFLNSVIAMLELNDVQAIHARAEDFLVNKEYREKFDYVVSRAVAPLATLLEITTPALKLGGHAIYYKSSSFDDELSSADNALNILGCEFREKINLNLGENFRVLAITEKIAKTAAKYPRNRNLPKIKPL